MGIRKILKGNRSKDLPSKSAASNDITDSVDLSLCVYGAINVLNTVKLIRTDAVDLYYRVCLLENDDIISFGCREPCSEYSEAYIDKKMLGIYKQSLNDIDENFRPGSMLNFIYYLPSQTDPKNYFERHFQKPLQECFPNKSWEGTIVDFAWALERLISHSDEEELRTLNSWSTKNLKTLFQPYFDKNNK